MSKIIFVTALVIYLLVIVRSGSNYQFWGAHGHDGIWHTAIASFSLDHYPVKSPIFAGAYLTGYNYASDYLAWALSKVGVPTLFSYFQLIPVLFIPLYLFLILKLGELIAKERKELSQPIYLIVMLFSGSFAWVLTLFNSQPITGSATILSDPILHLMSNWPYAFSLLTFFTALIVMYQKKIHFNQIILLTILTTLTSIFKLYGGIVLMPMVALYILLYYGNLPQKLSYIFFLASVVLASIFVFYRPDLSSTRLILSPFSIINKITEEPNQFYMPGLTNARYTLESTGLSPRLVAVYVLNTVLFFFFHAGIKFFGLLFYLYLLIKKKLSKMDLVMGFGVAISFFGVSMFIQSGEWWNPTQFIFYGLILLSIYASLLMSKVFIHNRLASLIILSLSLVYILDLVHIFVFSPPNHTIKMNEVRALQFLSLQENGVVLAENSSNTAYVTAISGMQSYFANPGMLKVTGIDYHIRQKLIIDTECKIIQDVNYLYLLEGDQSLEKFLYCNDFRLELIYDQNGIKIYKKVI